MWQQLLYYVEIFKVFFNYDIPSWSNKLLKLSLIIFMLIGFFKQWRKQLQLMDVFFIAYLLLLLLYPYQAEGMRFLLPLLAMAIFYLWVGLQSFKNVLKIKQSYFESIYLGIILIVQLYSLAIFLQKKTIIKGPQATHAEQAFAFIKNQTSNTETIAFCKPWILPLYVNRTALSYRLNETLPELTENMVEHEVNYILLASDSSDLAVYNAVLARQLKNSQNFKSIWKNAAFVLYLRQ
jgi:hypothetical protein